MSTKKMLEAENLRVSYGPIQAVRGVSFAMYEGECVAIVGANGAGKTSLLSAIVGLIPLAGGRVFYDGQEITGCSPERNLGRSMVLVPERRQVFASMTVEENLLLGAYGLGRGFQARQELPRFYEMFPVLGERSHQRAGTLSGGEQQMLAIARGLMSRPRLLMIDEPSLGLAPVVVDSVAEVLQSLAKSGLTILLVEQNVAVAMGIAKRMLLMEQGEIVGEQLPGEGITQEELVSVYLGGSR
jgi:branched-chain amino acid transport system ATP-binding protein